MTFTYNYYLFYLSEIICLNTFSKFLNFVHITFKLSVLSNYAEHSKKLALYCTLLLFKILKSPYSMGHLPRLEKMTLV